MSESSIYQAPKANLNEKENILKADREYFIAIARRQKHLIYTFLIYFIASGLGGASDEIKPLIQLIAIPLMLAIIIFNIRLCWKLYGVVGRIIMISLGLIPLLNFIVILVANSKTNSILKKAGFKVGFLGANIREVEQR